MVCAVGLTCEITPFKQLSRTRKSYVPAPSSRARAPPRRPRPAGAAERRRAGAVPQYAFITLRECTVSLVNNDEASGSGAMCSLGALLDWEADDPGDNVVLGRLTRLIAAHLPDGWQEWKVHTYSKEDLLGSELDPQILNKIRFAIPTENSAYESSDDDCVSAHCSDIDDTIVPEQPPNKATLTWEPPEAPFGSEEDFDWLPCTKPQDPVIPNPKPHIAEQGVKVLRLGDTAYNQIRERPPKRSRLSSPEVAHPKKRDRVLDVPTKEITLIPPQPEGARPRDTLRRNIEVPEIRLFRGGRLRSYLEVWKKEGAPKSILNIVKGYTIPFVSKPPLIPFHAQIIKKFETKEMTQEINSLIDQDILEHTSAHSGFLSTMFPVPKSDGKNRPIINLRGLNKYLLPKKFRLLNHFKVPQFLQPGDFLVKIDISQAYFHVPIKVQHRRFLAIFNQGQILQFTCLPFGLSTAPLTFARLSNWVASRFQDMNIRVIVYLDDFLLACQDPIKLREDAIKTVNFLTRLGWIINKEKSLNEPSQQIEYLGITWNTLRNVTSLPQRKIQSIEKDFNKILKDRKWSWELAKSLLGKLNFASFVIPLGRLHSRDLQRAANHLPEQQKKRMFPITSQTLQECVWWLANLKQNGTLVKYRKTAFITSDASDQGWGAQIDDKMISGLWTPTQKRWHINRKELYAVLQAFRSEMTYLREKRVIVQSDNRTVVAYIKKQGGTRSRHLTMLVSQLLHTANTLRTDLCPQYIPGIYNDIADSLSRQKPLADWHLSQQVTNLIFCKWGTPEIDLFATKESRVVPAYVSRDAKDKEAQFVDAFSRVWQFDLAWIFPPPSIIPRVLAHLNHAKGTYIIIVPRWEKVFWRSDLKMRAVDPPFQIRNLNHHLLDMTTQAGLPNAQNLRLEAWRIRGGRP
ncbi:uncharacterized protein LOC134659432 [Cydia amplana]|uniref:uncharacterized protein LOC134659432 n=1 Tax=Cydia amplana TaxID=1869771 RepID=UPI002FE57ADE